MTSLQDIRLLRYYHVLGAQDHTTDRAISRAELIQLGLNARGVNVGQAQSTFEYRDVSRQSWYYPYIHAATQLGVVSGYPDGTFRPNSSVSRAEAAKILIGILGLTPYGHSATSFGDIAWDDPLGPYVEAAYQSCLLHGINTVNGVVPAGHRRLF